MFSEVHSIVIDSDEEQNKQQMPIKNNNTYYQQKDKQYLQKDKQIHSCDCCHKVKFLQHKIQNLDTIISGVCQFFNVEAPTDPSSPAEKVSITPQTKEDFHSYLSKKMEHQDVKDQSIRRKATNNMKIAVVPTTMQQSTPTQQAKRSIKYTYKAQINNRYTTEQKVRYVKYINEMVKEGHKIIDICKKVGIPDNTYRRWNKEINKLDYQRLIKQARLNENSQQ